MNLCLCKATTRSPKKKENKQQREAQGQYHQGQSPNDKNGWDVNTELLQESFNMRAIIILIVTKTLFPTNQMCESGSKICQIFNKNLIISTLSSSEK